MCTKCLNDPEGLAEFERNAREHWNLGDDVEVFVGNDDFSRIQPGDALVAFNEIFGPSLLEITEVGEHSLTVIDWTGEATMDDYRDRGDGEPVLVFVVRGAEPTLYASPGGVARAAAAAVEILGAGEITYG